MHKRVLKVNSRTTACRQRNSRAAVTASVIRQRDGAADESERAAGDAGSRTSRINGEELAGVKIHRCDPRNWLLSITWR